MYKINNDTYKMDLFQLFYENIGNIYNWTPYPIRRNHIGLRISVSIEVWGSEKNYIQVNKVKLFLDENKPL